MEVVNLAPSVYLNGRLDGNLGALQTIPLDAVDEIRFIPSSRARDVWGPSCPCSAGVIYVRTRSSKR